VKLIASKIDSSYLAILSLSLFLFIGCGKGQQSNLNKSGSSELNQTKEKKLQLPDRQSGTHKSNGDSNQKTGIKSLQKKREAARIYRVSDSPDRAKGISLQEHGISRYSSKRFILYTDIDEEVAQTIPPMVDQLYETLVEYFGELHPNREETEFRVTGYLMRDRNSFTESKLLPEDLPGFSHGRHLGTEFWMNDQKEDYYRRHLLFHEFTHCFMTIMPGMEAPGSYLEGMAELFGTHRLVKFEGAVQCLFRVFPDGHEYFKGFGRIEMIQKDLKEGTFLSISDVQNLPLKKFSRNENYAWSWAYCYFLSHHRAYQKQFQLFGQYHVRTVGSKTIMDQFVSPDRQKLETEWKFFVHDLCYGYQLKPTFIGFRPGNDLKADENKGKIKIEANRGWQSGGIRVTSGNSYHVSAKGKFKLSDDPKPWLSEPQGVSIAYFRGKPLGLLWATIIDDSLKEDEIQTAFPMIPVGNEHQFQAKMNGTLYFRINDYGDSLLDNSGTIEIDVERVEAP
jgi:hypothetical protein